MKCNIEGPWRWLIACAMLTGGCPSICHAAADRNLDWFDAWRWTRFTQASGLPSKQVLDVVETGKGTVWANTAAGVSYFDGYIWKPAPGLPARSAKQLQKYDAGRVLLAFDNELYIGDENGMERWALPPRTWTVAAMEDGSVTGQTTAYQLFRIQNGKWKEIGADEASPVPPGFFRTRQGTNIRREALDHLLGRLGETLRKELDKDARNANQYTNRVLIYAMAENSKGEGVAVVRYPPPLEGLWEWSSKGAANRNNESRGMSPEKVEINESGDALLFSRSGRFYSRSAGVWKKLEPLPQMFRNTLTIRSRKGDSFWLAADDGLYLYRGRVHLWRNLSPHEAETGAINQIWKRKDGSYWVATERGLIVLRANGRMEWIKRGGGQEFRHLTSVVEDASGNIWVSGGAGLPGAVRFDGKSWKHFGEAEGLKGGPVHRMFADKTGRMWFLCTGILQAGNGPKGGAWVLEGRKFQRWGVEEGLPEARVYGMAEEENGTLWFGGAGFVSRYEKGAWKHYTAGQGVKAAAVFTVAVDRKGQAWFGDRLNGLGFIGPEGKARYYTVVDGLISNNVQEVKVDREGAIWMAAHGGLASFRDGIFRRFGVYSGLENLSLWPLLVLDNELCTAGSSGSLDCLERSHERFPAPRIEIDKPAVDGERTQVRWKAVSYWGYIPENEIETRYRLDGGKWSEWTLGREAQYYRLASGKHRVQVQANSPYGVFDPNGASAEFAIAVPFYWRGPFLLGLGTVLVLIAVAGTEVVKRRAKLVKALETSERRFRALIENSSDCIVLVDAEWRVQYASPSVERVLGYTVENLRGGPHSELIHPEDLAALSQKSEELAVKAGSSVSLHYRVKHKNGTYRWIESVGVNLLREPVVRAIVFNFRDITDKMKADEELVIARRQAEAASRAKSEFLATMSHEIRTPMNGILGVTDLIAGTALNEEQEEYFQVIRTSAQSLLRIINNILDISRIEAGAVMLEWAPFQIADIARDVETLLGPGAREKGIALLYTVPADCPVLMGDQGRLRQVVLNLAGNAIKFTQTGWVEVGVGVRMAGTGRAAVHVAVKDTGIGIPTDKLENVFGMFAQADASTTRRYGGSGLGLAIAKSIVELMGGSIYVKSEVGKGSEFGIQLTLPLASGEPQGRQPDTERGYPPLAGKVLLAEDNVVNQLVARRLLAKFGCSVDVAGTGAEAVEKWELGQPDVILMDCHMPEMDGYAAAKEIRRREQNGEKGRTPIVAMTANAMSGAEEECREAGMDAFLAKPVAMHDLYRELQKYVGVRGAVR